MKRPLIMLVLLVLLMPLTGRAGEVQDTARHFTFNLPAGWGMELPDKNAAGTYVLTPNNSTADYPVIKIVYEAQGFLDNPQAMVDEWKQNPVTPNKGTLVRNDVTYEKLTGHIVVDTETMLNGAAYMHVRLVMVSGKHSAVAVMLGDRTGDFWNHAAALNAVVASLQLETDAATADMGGSQPLMPAQAPTSGPGRGLVIGIVAAIVLLIGLGFGAVLVGALVWLMVRSSKNRKTEVRPVETRKPVVSAPGGMMPMPAVAVVGAR